MNDSYIEDQQAMLEVCEMIINNRHAFPAKEVEKAERIRVKTLENIKKREQVLKEQR